MFNESFYPTPANIIDLMLSGVETEGKVFLEPSAGKGDIVDALKDRGAKNVLSCEIDINLQRIVKTKSQFLTADFFEVDSANISHIDCIIMNPPFNQGAKHILHAYKIAPAGCNIIALCNLETLRNIAYQERRELKELIDKNGSFEDIGNAFQSAERKTGVNVALVRLKKEGASYSQEFEGFFMEEDIEAETGEGVMQYSEVRNLVNRYVEAVKLFDTQLDAGIRMKNLVSSFYHGDICFIATEQGRELKRNEFKKELQKSGWSSIFSKMNLTKYTTRGVREDINKFVEHQSNIPFTMRNIYRMFEIVIGTAEQRMDKAILEVFDRVTEHHHENRHHVKGWKTNSHYLVGKKFILPNMVNPAKEYGYTSNSYRSLRSSYDGIIPDLEKALCYVTGLQYDEIKVLNSSITNNIYGEWYESEFFKYKAYKNGNMHFEWNNEEIWGKFNQKVSKLKGYPIYEAKPQTAYQKRQTGKQEPKQTANPTQNILFNFNIQ